MSNINLDQPRYNQETFCGRAKHFFRLTNPLNVFATNKQLDEAKKVVETFRKTRTMPKRYDEKKLWAAKYLYDSAFHPVTGEKVNKIGRISSQVYMNTLITGCMISFYKSNKSLAFWQWANQTFNAIVNYSNQSGDGVITQKQSIRSYLAACGGALTTALYLKNKVRGMNPLYARLVPFAAVGAANFINIPMIRINELYNGTPVFTPDGQRVGNSEIAAFTGVFLVCMSRLAMAIPAMALVPMITNAALRRCFFCPDSKAIFPFQLSLVALCASVATPLCCALFKQKANIGISRIEPFLKEKALKLCPNAKTVYYNKGL